MLENYGKNYNNKKTRQSKQNNKQSKINGMENTRQTKQNSSNSSDTNVEHCTNTQANISVDDGSDDPYLASLTQVNKNCTVPIKLNNILCNQALLDSGASITCISKKFFDHIAKFNQVEVQESNVQNVKGVSGSLIPVLGKVNLEVQIQSDKLQHSFYIIQTLTHQVILGQDFLTTHGFTINFQNMSLELHQGGMTQPIGPRPKLAIAAATINYTIPAKSYARIPVKIKYKQGTSTGILEPINQLLRKHNLVGAKVLMSQNNKCYEIMNPNEHDITIRRDQKLALFTPLQERDIINIPGLTISENDKTNAQPEQINVLFGDNKTPDQTSNTNDLTDDQCKQITSELGFDLDRADLTDIQKGNLVRLLASNRSVFAKDITELGESNCFPHYIDTGDAPPIRQRPYKTSPHMKNIIGNHIDEMEKANIIEPSVSQWQSPVVMIKKQDGSYRFAVDYRQLNKVTKPVNLPMMSFESVVEALGDGRGKIFSVLDCASGFWQVKLDPATAEKTAFTSHRGVYQFRRLPFGLMNSPSAFSLVMGEALRSMNWKNLLIYVDDLCVFSSDFDSHLVHLEQLFQLLSKANLKLKPQKCQFAKPQIHYLGHVISAKGIQVNPDKMSAVKTFPTPKNQKDVRGFLGLCNYYRKFIKGFSHLATPLNNLLKKSDDKFKWSPECQTAFDGLKNALTSEPVVLAYPDFEKPFIVSTDASNLSIGYILSQEDDQGRERVIAYGGKSLNKHQANYTISEKECLAIFEGIKYFNHFLEGHEFTVITDHDALRWLYDKKEPRNRLGRWVTELQSHNFKVKHREGKKHINADALSRRTYEIAKEEQIIQKTENSNKVSLPEKISDVAAITSAEFIELRFTEKTQHTASTAVCNSLQAMMNSEAEFLNAPPIALIEELQNVSQPEMSKLQREDPDLKLFFEHKKANILPTEPSKANFIATEARHHSISDGILYHNMVKQGKGTAKERTIQQLVIPSKLRDDILRSFHDAKLGGGHQGIERTRELIKRKYYWHKMDSDIETYVKSCDVCQRTKQLYHGYRAPLRPLPVEDIFSRWHMDILGPLPSSNGYKHIILFVDSFSKWCEAFPLKTQKATEVAEVLYNEIICRYGAPKSILSDRGKNFMSAVVQELCKMFQITRSHTSSYHPATNAQRERLNSVIAKGLRS